MSGLRYCTVLYLYVAIFWFTQFPANCFEEFIYTFSKFKLQFTYLYCTLDTSQ